MLWCVETGGVQMRAYRLALDPTAGQLDALQRHAGAARWAFNHALAAKRLAHQQRSAAIRELVDAGTRSPNAAPPPCTPLPNS